MLETDEGSDEKAITAMGLLNTIETLLTVMEEQPEIMAQLQPTVLGVVGHIFTNSVMGEHLANIASLSTLPIPTSWYLLGGRGAHSQSKTANYVLSSMLMYLNVNLWKHTAAKACKFKNLNFPQSIHFYFEI